MFLLKATSLKEKSLPPGNSRRILSESMDLQNHMYCSSFKLKFSKIDQENLSMKVDTFIGENFVGEK